MGVTAAEEKGTVVAEELVMSVVVVASSETVQATAGEAQLLSSESPITCLYSRISCVRFAWV